MKKLIISILIITSLLFVACKNGSNSSGGGGSGTTTPANTPLQGTWVNSANNETLVFNGSTFSDSSIISTSPVMSLAVAGTFRLDNNQILATPKTASIRTIHVVTADSGTTPTYQASDLPHTDDSGEVSVPLSSLNQETTWGAYSLNGDTLRVSDPSDASIYKDFTKP